MKPTRFALAVSMALFGSSALAADFTFNIPLRVENTVIWRINISCSVYENELLDDGRMGGTHGVRVGSGSVGVEMVDGSFDGVVTVEVDAEPGTYPALARSYWCQLSASWPVDPEAGYQPGVGSVAIHPGRFQESYEERSGYRLESVTTSIRGRIEQQ